MAMAAGLRIVKAMTRVGSCGVGEQKMWSRKARVKVQQGGTRRPGLCFSVSGEGSQFARKKLSDKDVHLMEELQSFIAVEHLLPNQLPSIKDLMSKGRLDLANAVRSRGYKAVSRMLAGCSKLRGSSGSESDSGNREFAIEVVLSSQVEPAGEIGSEDAIAERMPDDAVIFSAPGNGAMPEQRGAVLQDNVVSLQDESASSQNDASTILQQEVMYPATDGSESHSQSAGVEEGRRVQLPSSQLSLQERAKMFVRTGKANVLRESGLPGAAGLVLADGDAAKKVRDAEALWRPQRMTELPKGAGVQEAMEGRDSDSLKNGKTNNTESQQGRGEESVGRENMNDSAQAGLSKDFWNFKAVVVEEHPEVQGEQGGFDSRIPNYYYDSDGKSWEDDQPGGIVPEREETINAHRVAMLRAKLQMDSTLDSLTQQPNIDDIILSILAKQREIGRLTERDKELDAQFRADAKVELEKIKSVLQYKEAETSSLRQELAESRGELALMKAELGQAKQQMLEREMLLQDAEVPLARLKRVTLEWWGEGQQVELAGSFNGWQHFLAFEPDLTSEIPNFDGSRGSMLWGLDIWLYPGTYEIKFIVDGDWVVDPRRETVMRNNVRNNILRVDL